MQYIVARTLIAAATHLMPIRVSSQGTSLRVYSSPALYSGRAVWTLAQPSTNGSIGPRVSAEPSETPPGQFTANLVFMIDQIRRHELTPPVGIRDLLGRAIRNLDSRRDEDIAQWSERLADDVARADD